MTDYFYDSYAIISYINGSQNYEKYFKDKTGITTFYNAMEVYHQVSKEFGEMKANEVLTIIKTILIQPKIEDIPQAMAFKIKNSRKYSYADCLGYAMSLRLGFKFLTGDEGFKGLFNVEFVKEK